MSAKAAPPVISSSGGDHAPDSLLPLLGSRVATGAKCLKQLRRGSLREEILIYKARKKWRDMCLSSGVAVWRRRVVEQGDTGACTAGVLFGRSIKPKNNAKYIQRCTVNVSTSRKNLGHLRYQCWRPRRWTAAPLEQLRSIVISGQESWG